MNETWKKKLNTAQGLIADVQIEMLREDDRRDDAEKTEDWRELYRIRGELARFMDRMQRKSSTP